MLSLLKRCDLFFKAAIKDPSFDPEEVEIFSDPEDDYDLSTYKGLPTSDIGSNYGYLTEPRHFPKDEEKEAFLGKLDDIISSYDNFLSKIEQDAFKLNMMAYDARPFIKKSINHLIKIIADAKSELYDISVPGVENNISHFKSFANDAKNIRGSLFYLLESEQDQEEDKILSQTSRMFDRFETVIRKLIKDLNSAITSSTRKYVGKGIWE